MRPTVTTFSVVLLLFVSGTSVVSTLWTGIGHRDVGMEDRNGLGDRAVDGMMSRGMYTENGWMIIDVHCYECVEGTANDGLALTMSVMMWLMAWFERIAVLIAARNVGTVGTMADLISVST